MEFNSTNLFVLMYKWRKPLIIIPLAAAILAYVFSRPMFITPLFKSSVVLFPSTTNSVSKALLPQQNSFSNEDILEFGTGSGGSAEAIATLLPDKKIIKILVLI